MSTRSIALFCRPGVLTAQTRAQWTAGGITLITCTDITDLYRIPLDRFLGALLDVELDIQKLFHLAEELERRQWSFVFIVSEHRYGPYFRLSGGRQHIREIEEELLFQNDDGRRH